MTLPAATFAVVPPPADGLVLAFTAARRRRNSKAAVSAFGGAVAIASVLSFLAPPGQTLVQEPAQPAGGLLPGIGDAPRHGAPGPQVRPPAAATTTGRSAADSVVVVTRRTGLHNRPARVAAAVDPCAGSRTLACASLPVLVEGGPTGQAELCDAAARVTVEYDAAPVGPTRVHTSRTVEVGDGCRS